jgi:hypothetical protein
MGSLHLNKLTRITLKNFSNLVYKIHNEPEFSVAILAILEATSMRSLLIIPSSFAVIIEQLSKHLMYVSAKLYTLISKLILKSIRYSGYVYNEAKYLEKLINIKTDEEYFERI